VPSHGGPVVNPKIILSSFNNFWAYWYRDVRLSEDFVPYNENDSVIGKDYFLREVSSGKYFPLKLKSHNTLTYYKLYKMSKTVDKSIREDIVMRFGELSFEFFKMEGTPLRGFNFVDINGKVYNKETCKGKIVVLNFWFIGCTACKRKMPDLNKMVTFYRNRNDVVFVSIAPDNADSIKKFLQKTPFDYAAIPNKAAYVRDTLGIQMFPTQMIIDRKGQIAKVPEDYKELTIELRKELLK
jgi:peroxiredoxin